MNNLSNLEEILNYRRANSAACLVIDTNILLLFFIGAFDQSYICQCPLMTENGKKYDKSHYELMENLLKIFLGRIVITPHVLSEINMLSRKRIKPTDKMNALFAKILERLEKCKEKHVDLEVLLKNGGVVKFGFTDISLVEVASKNNGVILTDEFPLYSMYREHVPIIYFSNLVVSEIHKVRI